MLIVEIFNSNKLTYKKNKMEIILTIKSFIVTWHDVWLPQKDLLVCVLGVFSRFDKQSKSVITFIISKSNICHGRD